MKKHVSVVLAALLVLCLLQPSAVMAEGTSSTSISMSTITVSLRTEGSRKCRTIRSGVSMRILARSGSGTVKAGDLVFRTTNPAVADVDARGVLRTGRAGRADILVRSADGTEFAAVRLTVKDDLFEEETKKGKAGSLRRNPVWMIGA